MMREAPARELGLSAAPVPVLLAVLLAVLLTVLLTTGTAAAAEGEPDYSRAGAYLSLSGLWVSDLYEKALEDQLNDAFGPVNVDIENSGGLSARAGVRLLAFLAIELQYDWVSEYEVEFEARGPPGDRSAIDVHQQTLTANARIILPIGRVQPFLLAGVGFQRFRLNGEARLAPTLIVRETATNTVLAGRVGAGVEVYLNEHVALLFEGTAVLTNEEIELNGETINHIFYGALGLGATFRF